MITVNTLDTTKPLPGLAGQWLLLYGAGSVAIKNKRNGLLTPGERAKCVEAQEPLKIPDFIGQWLALAAAAYFAKQAFLEIRFRKMPTAKRMNWVMYECRPEWLDHVSSGHLQTPMADYIRKALEMQQALKSPEFVCRRALLHAMALGRCRIWKRRIQARAVLSCLTAWRTSGVVYKRLADIKKNVKRMQQFWRSSRIALCKAQDDVERMFLRVERSSLFKELRTEDESRAPGARRKASESVHALAEERMVEESFRLTFIENELRARRFFHLTKIEIWEGEMRQWREDMEVIRQGVTLKAAQEDKDEVEDGSEVRFAFPPDCPSYMPTEDEVFDMWVRARQAQMEGVLGGWLNRPTRGQRRRTVMPRRL
jgi:hypothetical protein